MTITNNDILRRIRYTFDFNDTMMMKLFGLGAHPATREKISNWLKKEDDPEFQECSNAALSAFLDGLILEKRGPKDGAPAEPVEQISNNLIFRKLRIALNLQAEEVLEILALAEMPISKHELSAFFRKPTHKHYRECKDQILRNFLQGLQLKYRDNPWLRPADAKS